MHALSSRAAATPRRVTARPARAIAAAATLLAALPAIAYVLPGPALLRLAARKRAEAPAAVELRGVLTTGATAPAAVVLWAKAGRCRLELVGVPDRPYAVVRNGRVAAQRGLEGVPGAAALAEGACTLLSPIGAEGYAQALSARGIPTGEASLALLGPRVAYVFGAAQAPQAWFDKGSLQPLRLVADLGGARRDLQLAGYPAPPAAAAGEKAPPPEPTDAFPRAIEVHRDDGLEARLAVDRVAPNPRIPDSLL
jgi:hypothetical protein